MAPFEHWTGRRVSFAQSKTILSKQLSNLFRTGPSRGSVRALEVGCGDGQFTSSLWKIFAGCHSGSEARLYSLDLDLTAVAIARRRFEKLPPRSVHLVRGNLYDLPVAKGTLDYFLAFNVFYWADRHRLLQEAGRVLKEDGRVFTYDLVPTPNDGLRPVFYFMLEQRQITGSRRPGVD